MAPQAKITSTWRTWARLGVGFMAFLLNKQRYKPLGLLQKNSLLSGGISR